jgi:nucleoside-diphosphate-sugar epimerase
MNARARALVLGGGGFLGHHCVTRLKAEGHWVRAVDRQPPQCADSAADEFVFADLSERRECAAVFDGVEHVYQFAADMGGAGYIFTGEHDADIMARSARINLNVLACAAAAAAAPRVFFASSACIYPEYNQRDPDNPICGEDSAYPALPDSEYGWEKLFAERLYAAHHRAGKIDARIARLHNVYGPGNCWQGGREKAPAAICRKVAQAPDGGEIEIWGDGAQTRSFLYVDDAIDGIYRLMGSGCSQPVNIGSPERISIRALTDLVIAIAGKRLSVRCVAGPQGVRGRTSDNRRALALLGWEPAWPLRHGLGRTYEWIAARAASPPVSAADSTPAPSSAV